MRLVLALCLGLFALPGPTVAQDADVAPPVDANLDRLALLATSNQIVFRPDGGKLEPVCRCGPKPYLHEMSIFVRDAVVAIEDQRFYSHKGVDPVGISRAIGRWVTGRSREGGSTITQQLVKNTVLDPRRSAARKLAEVRIAPKLDEKLGKAAVLRAYLNQAVFANVRGRPVVGVEQAARHFFGRRALDLTLRESALLAGMLKGPSLYNPLRHPERAMRRAKLVLRALRRQGKITAEQEAFALSDAAVRPRGPHTPHFAEARPFIRWVLAELKRAAPGFTPGRYTRIPITLEMQSQADAERALRRATPNTRRKGGDYGFVTMSKQGRVVVFVGGKDYGASQFSTVVQAKRQPASAFKPIVYLAGIEAGLVRDTAELRDAMARSDNVVPRAIVEEVGEAKVVDAARRLGISSPLREDLSLALGTSEVTLMELTAAYAALANGGERCAPWGWLGLVDDGTLREWNRPVCKRASTAEDVATLAPLLEAVVREGTARGAVREGVHGKTGTSDGNRDAWFIGWKGRRVSGLWLGHPNGGSLGTIDGTDAAIVWGKVDAVFP